MTLLAEAQGEPVTAQRTAIYADDLLDIPKADLETAFARARRELKYFPRVAELREFAGVVVKDLAMAEAEAAWEYVARYLAEWGVDRVPEYLGRDGDAKWNKAPAFEGRIDHALRQIGGLIRIQSALDLMDEETAAYAFTRKEFLEAYRLAPLAASLPALPVGEMGDTVKRLAATKSLAAKPKVLVIDTPLGPAVEAAVKQIPRYDAPPTPDQLRDRAAEQKHRLAQYLRKHPEIVSSETTETRTGS